MSDANWSNRSDDRARKVPVSLLAGTGTGIAVGIGIGLAISDLAMGVGIGIAMGAGGGGVLAALYDGGDLE